MRSPREIATRLRQEAVNVRLWASPPTGRFEQPWPLALPTPPRELPAYFAELADEIEQRRVPLLGFVLDVNAATPGEVRWRRDYSSGIETGRDYFRRVPYLDATLAGDHKVIWELNRHQHLVLLAQCGRAAAVIADLESWLEANPFQRGINWTSALEVGFRALSWIWIYHLIGDQFPPEFRVKFLESLNQHGLHLENNLSYYFSPNTHLLGEAVALHAIGKLFPGFPGAQNWRKLGARVVDEQMMKQVQSDGSHFEQSTYYHVYALDMFLFHAILERKPPQYLDRLTSMGDFLHAILGPERKLAFLGDDDGGRFFHPYGVHDEYGRASLATLSLFLKHEGWAFTKEDLWPQAAWWLGMIEGEGHGKWDSHLFADAGIAVMTAADVHVMVDAGKFGPWGSGHSHSDTLSIVIRRGAREILIDPGTFTYVGNPRDRDKFRGSASHNTVRIDGADQAKPVNPFRWQEQPAVKVLNWCTSSVEDVVDAECQYSGFTHRRRVVFRKPALVEIEDEVTGPAGVHDLEQFWHLGPDAQARAFQFDGQAEQMPSSRSRAFGSQEPATVLRMHRRAALPTRLHTSIDLEHA